MRFVACRKLPLFLCEFGELGGGALGEFAGVGVQFFYGKGGEYERKNIKKG